MDEKEIVEARKKYTQILKTFEKGLQKLSNENHVFPEIECDTDIIYKVGSPIGIPKLRIRLKKLLFTIE